MTEQQAIEIILEAIAMSDYEDEIGTIKVDIPAEGYPRQNIRVATRRIFTNRIMSSDSD